MEPTPLCAWTRLYHPRGPQVTLPLPTDPLKALQAVSDALDAGWLVVAPGLEEGEEKEQVAFVVRGDFEREGKETPYLLLYSDNDAYKHSFLKVYLNSPEDIAAFEYASAMRLRDIPPYIGQDKPERGKSKAVDRFICAAPRPFGVVYRANPKYEESASLAARAKGEIYKVPRRLFVRWADTAPVTEPGTSAPSEEEMGELDTLVREWERVGQTKVNISKMLAWLGAASLQSLTREQYDKAVSDLKTKIASKEGGK